MFRVMRASYDGAGDAGGGGEQAARGRYRIEGTLGRGTLGTVHRALDTEQGRPVAIKLFDRDIDPDGDAARRMLADLEVAAGLLNPHLVPALDAGVLDGQLFVVEPLLEGQSLSDRLARAPLPPMETVRLALEVLVGLDALHRHLLNHLDLHPRNIFIVRDPVGLERVLVSGVGQHHALALDNARGRSQGTSRARPEYLAPEIISGKPRDVRTDIYQLGLVMYASLTGSPPFIGGDPEKVARRHALERPPSPMNKRPEAEVPDALDTVVVRCLEKIPRKRYSSAMELTRDLEQVARKGAAGAIGTSGRFRAVNFSDVPRAPSSAPPPREPTGSLGGSIERSPSSSVEEVFQSPSGSVEEPPPFADFDAEPPPAGPPTHIDVRKLLSPPPKIDRPPRFADGLPAGLTGDRPQARPAPAPAPAAERPRRATPPIASGRSPVDDAAPAAAPSPATPARGAADAGLSESAVSSQTLVDPLFRPPLRVPTADPDDTGSHELSSFPGAALVGDDDARGVDNAETRAPTAPVELGATMLGGPRPGIEAAVEADLSERTAFDGGAASQAAAAAVAAADAIEAGSADPAVAGRPAVADDPPEPAGSEPAADAGPSEMGDAGPDPGESGWSVGDDPALDDDITHGLPRPSRAPWAIAALLIIIVGAAFALYQRETAETPEAAEGPEPPSKIAIAAQPPPEPPSEAEAAEPEAPAPDGAAEVRALEARARAALAAKRWRGSPDALAESLAALRTAAPDAPTIRELSTRGAEQLLTESRAALAADDYDTALDRARSALAVAPGFASAERQIADVAQARAAQAKAAQASAAAEQQKADQQKAEQQKADQQKADQQKADQQKADQEKAEQQKARQARAERAARAEADEEATALAAAEAARQAQAEQERKEREAAAAAAAAEAEKAARAQARQEAKALVREGQGHIDGGRWDQAKQAFEQALERDAGLAAAHAGLGDVAFQQQRFADAVTHHRRSVQNHKSNAGYHVNLGMAYFKLKNYAQAKASWEKALELDPGNAKATKYLGVVEKKL